MPTQTGSIDLKSSNGVKSYAAAGFTNAANTYATQTALEQTNTAVTASASKLLTVANPNLSPFFEQAKADVYNATNSPKGYWRSNGVSNSTYVTTWDFEQETSSGGGWVHIVANNTSSSATYAYFYVNKDAQALKPSTNYTFLVEWRDVTLTGSPQVQCPTAHGGTNGANDDFFTASKITYPTAGSGSARVTATTRSAYESACPNLVRGQVEIPASAAISGYIRISLYEESYDSETQTWTQYSGPWKPYSGSVLYASQSELKVQADRIGMVVSNQDASSSLQLTANAMTYIGNNVEIKDSTGSSTVIQGGKLHTNQITVGSLADGSSYSTTSQMNTAIGNAVDDIEVGGRNLLQGSMSISTAAGTPGWYLYGNSSVVELVEVDGEKLIHLKGTPATSYIPSIRTRNRVNLEWGETYVMSCDMKFDKAIVTQTLTPQHYHIGSVANYDIYNLSIIGNGGGVTMVSYSPASGVTIPANTWAHYERVFKTNQTAPSSSYPCPVIAPFIYGQVRAVSESVEVNGWAKNWKIEKGNKATDWTPAPEDVDAGIADAAKTATNYITADSTGIKIASANPSTATTYQHQTSSNTTFYVGGKKRSTVDANGLEVFDGNANAEVSVAKFGSTARIGKASGESRMEMDYHSLQLIDKDNSSYFNVSDLRTSGASTVSIIETFEGNGTRTNFMLSVPTCSNVTVKVNGTTQQLNTQYFVRTGSFNIGTYVVSIPYIEFVSAPASAAAVSVSYTTSEFPKAFTFGTRVSGTVGTCSFAEGLGNVASKAFSHVEGYRSTSNGMGAHAEGSSVASGEFSHAQNNGTIAASPSQTALGKYNVKDNQDVYAVIVGKGSSDSSRSNAAALKWDGTLELAKALPVASGGTGQTTLAAARNAMGLGNTTGALPVANGGTGQTSIAAARNAFGLGNTTGAVPIANGGTESTGTTSVAQSTVVDSTGTNVAITTWNYYKWGKLAVMYAVVKPSAAQSSNWTAFTVKTGYRPPCSVFVGTSVTTHVAYLTNDGKCIVRQAGTANTTYYLFATYLLA